jgi:DNA-binding beta-propeller fold protein YncE
MRIQSFALLAAILLSGGAAAAAPAGYAVTGSIKGPDGGWDYASVDPATHRLYVAHGTAVTAVDLVTRTVTPALAGANRPHEVLPIPGSGLLLETDGGTGTARLLDAMTGAEKASIKVSENPDAAIWDAKRKHVIVMNAKSGTVMAIDPAKATVVGTVTLAPGLEFAAIDKEGLLYVNNEDRNQIAVVDLDKMAPLGWIDLKGCEEPSGMAYAPTADRLVSACGNGVAAVVDPGTRKLVGLLPIGKGPDAVIGDPARKRLFIPSGGSGTLAVFAEARGKVSPVGTVTTEVSARTGAVDPTTGIVYLPAAEMLPAQPGARRQAAPGSFHLIVVSPQ